MSGALTHSPAVVIQQLFVDLSIGTLPVTGSDWPIAVSQERDTPDEFITLYDTASVMQGRTMSDGVKQEQSGIQVRIRAATYDANHTKASEIQNAIDSVVRNTSVTVGSSIYTVNAISRKSSIIHIGKEPSSDRDVSTINATVAMRQTT